MTQVKPRPSSKATEPAKRTDGARAPSRTIEEAVEYVITTHKKVLKELEKR